VSELLGVLRDKSSSRQDVFNSMTECCKLSDHRFTSSLNSFQRGLLISQGFCGDINNLLQIKIAAIPAPMDIPIQAQACHAVVTLASDERGLKFFEELGVCERIIAILGDIKFADSYDIHLQGICALLHLAPNVKMERLMIEQDICERIRFNLTRPEFEKYPLMLRYGLGLM